MLGVVISSSKLYVKGKLEIFYSSVSLPMNFIMARHFEDSRPSLMLLISRHERSCQIFWGSKFPPKKLMLNSTQVEVEDDVGVELGNRVEHMLVFSISL